MKTNYSLYIFGIVIVTAILSACKKQIEIGAPVTKLVSENVFADNGTATAAQLSIYSQLAGSQFLYNFRRATGLASDELFTYASDQISKDIYTNALTRNEATTAPLTSFWNNEFNYIYQENAIIEGLGQSDKLSPKVRQQLRGEAKFMRAFFYFNLVNFYGDIPLVLNSDFNTNAQLARTPKEQVYQQIVTDLIAAQTDLNVLFVNATDTVSTVDRIRPTVWAADALLARVYLHIGSGFYDKAESQATAIITNSTLFNLPTDLNAVFKKNSSEAVWQISQYSGTSLTFTQDGTGFVLTSAPGTGQVNSSTVGTTLLNTFEPGDQRKLKWIGTYTSGTSSWNYPAKYKDNAKTATTTSEYYTLFRLAEQYLIRAEARARQNKLTGAGSALEDLNIIRIRAGLGNYTGPTDQASLITAIIHERQVELFVEGDRWITLKRTGTIDVVMNTITQQKGGTWKSYQQLFPIPPYDVLTDNKLIQNPGY